MAGAKPEVIQKTIADIKANSPDYIVLTHCTGFEAISAFATGTGRAKIPAQEDALTLSFSPVREDMPAGAIDRSW